MKHVTVRYGVFFLLSLAGFSFGLQRSITVSGVVVDSVTGQPVENAIVLLLDTSTSILNGFDLSKIPFDTVYSASNGSFSKSINASNPVLFYSIVKEGYALYLNYKIVLPTVTTVGLDTIRLVPSNFAAKDTLTVSGKIIDSVTGIGIPGALIGISGADLDTVGKTATADANGNFSSQAIITKVSGLSLSILGYIAYKQGYNYAMGSKLVTNKIVDLGTIRLVSISSVRWTKHRVYTSSNPTSMAIYSLNGRRLYTGWVAPLNRLLLHSTNAALVEFRHNGSIIDRKKVLAR